LNVYKNNTTLTTEIPIIYVENIVYIRSCVGRKVETRFYYPHEIWATVRIISNLKDSLTLAPVDSLKGIYSYNVYVTCSYRGKVFNWNTRKRRRETHNFLSEHSGIIINNIDLPVFDSVYNKKQISDFINDFTTKARFTINIKNQNGKVYKHHINTDSLKFIFRIDESQLDMNLIGYSDTITIIDNSIVGPIIGGY